LFRYNQEDSRIKFGAIAPEKAIAKRLSIQARQEEKLALEDAKVREFHSQRKRIEQELLEKEAKHRQEEEDLRKKISHERYLMAIRQSSAELRDLESKLKAGYIGKDRQLQLKQVEIERQRLILEEQKFNKEWHNEIEKQNALALVKEEEKLVQSDKYRQDLQVQMAATEKAREEKYKQFLEEKAAIDEVIRKIMEDDEKYLPGTCLRLTVEL
jgi:hypothetical protein